MDGQVAAIRNALDETGYVDIPILAYSAKYASGLYGPFREAVNVSLENSDRKSYQQDWRNKREAMNEIKADLDGGADMIMVKPAVTYLDIIAQAREITDVPIGAYHVSGEYSMIKAAGGKGWIDEKQVAIEQLTAVKRSGANFILTYAAKKRNSRMSLNEDYFARANQVIRWSQFSRSIIQISRRYSILCQQS